MSCTGSETFPPGFPLNFTYGYCTFSKIWNSPNPWKCPYYIKGFFCVNSSNSFEFEETAVMGVFGNAEFESVLNIRVSPFLVALGPIFARKFGITPARWVLRARRRFHCASRSLLQMDAVLFRKFWKSPNPFFFLIKKKKWKFILFLLRSYKYQKKRL